MAAVQKFATNAGVEARAHQHRLNPRGLSPSVPLTALYLWKWLAFGIDRVLDVFLHIGAHRTGTTTLQNAIEHNRHNLMKTGTIFWGPGRTRSGLFNGMLTPKSRRSPETDVAMERSLALISMELNRLRGQGADALLISEENILGSMRQNLGQGMLYPHLRERLIPFRKAFGAHCVRISLAVRSLDEYWSSCLAYALSKNIIAPNGGLYRQLSEQPRRWQDVVTDIRAVFSEAEIAVWEFSRAAGRSDLQYQVVSCGYGFENFRPVQGWHNRSPSVDTLRELVPDEYKHRLQGHGRLMPFHPGQIAQMARAYAEDLAWLRDAKQKDGITFAMSESDQRKDRFFVRRGNG